MSYLGDLLQFEGFHGKEILKDIWNKPTRLLTGVDPASTKLWNGILGTDDKPIVDQMGGATSQRYKDAEAAGIDTSAGRTGQNIAHVVAALYGAQGLGNALGGTGSGASSLSTAEGPAGVSSGTGGLMGGSGGGTSGAGGTAVSQGLSNMPNIFQNSGANQAQEAQLKRRQMVADMLRKKSQEDPSMVQAGRVFIAPTGQIIGNMLNGIKANQLQTGIDADSQALAASQANTRSAYADALAMALRRNYPQSGTAVLPPDGYEDQ